MLRVTEVTSGYGSTMVLRRLSLLVPEGKVTAIVGRNGSGKTTLVRTIMGYNQLHSGTLQFGGQEIGKLATDRRARLGIGYVPQGRHIFPDLTVAENLEIGKIVGSDRPDRQLMTDRIHAMFPILAQRRHQKGATMSGGQQQMVAIARALIGRPTLLILDEPSEGIQPSIVGEIEQQILNLKLELGLTVFVAEQDVQLIKVVADICHVIERGRIVETLQRDEFVGSDLLERRLAL